MKLRRVAAGAISVVLAITMVSTSAFAVDPSFKDVPSNHWAKQSITAMADKGIMTGVADGVFAPSNTLTYAEFFTMLTRQFYADKLSGEGEYWYSQFVAAAAAAGIDQGLSMKSVTDVITRYDMAQIMYNLMSKKGVQMPSNVDTSKIADSLTGARSPRSTRRPCPSATASEPCPAPTARAPSTALAIWTGRRQLLS